MQRLVIISNRTADPHEERSGGLAVALWSTLKKSGGLWIGWNGNICHHNTPAIKSSYKDGVEFYTTDLTSVEYDNFYVGYANSVLWPVFHNRVDLAENNIVFKTTYEQTNRRFVASCADKISKDDYIWVHDYQMIPCGLELRKKGILNNIGFFLHIPFPPAELVRSIPDHHWLITCLLSYDLIGFQTENDLRNFHNYIISHTDTEERGGYSYIYKGRVVRAGVFPIGIDPAEITECLNSERSKEMSRVYKKNYSCDIIIGVDRLDYSKGIPHRIHTMRHLFEIYPEKKKEVSLLQIASPSREKVSAYERLSEKMDYLSGKINGDLGDLHWSPVNYIHQNIQREDLPTLFRMSKVGLVTPLCDGMNLVAKEYIASQDPENPGVLILSEFAGAAQQFKDALVVNPFDTNATARAIHQALVMPLNERKKRYQTLMKSVVNFNVHWWCETFLTSLKEPEVWLVA